MVRGDRFKATQLLAAVGVVAIATAMPASAQTTGSAEAAGVDTVSQAELAESLRSDARPFVLDVRGSGEYWVGHIPGAVHIPHTELPDRLDEIDVQKDKEIVVYCEGEWRAREAAPVLREAGFSEVRVLSGGIEVWREENQPISEPEAARVKPDVANLRIEKKRTDTLVVHFFGASTCGKCMEIKRELLDPLGAEHEDTLDVRVHDINEETQFGLMVAMTEAYGESGTCPQMLFVSDWALCGYDEIMSLGRDVIVGYLQTPTLWHAYVIETEIQHRGLGDYLRGKADEFSVFGIIAAGVADGLNPCAIATIIFLVSFLTTQKRTRSEVLVVGLSFTFAVYVTYLLLGIGAFKGLVQLEAYHWLSEGMRWIAIALACGIGVFCFIDAFRYRKTQDTGAIRIQLPEAVKSRIHNVIKSRLSGTQLVLSAVVVGFLVTLLEAVCTGQVYLPTIVLMTKSESLRMQGWLCLLLYCFLFVLPLLIVMVLAYFGLTWQRLSTLTKRHLVGLKILLGVVLIALAVFLYLAG